MAPAAEHAVLQMSVSTEPVKQIPLTNDGDLEIYFIGTGSAFAKTLNQNNIIITKGNHHVVVDCGTKCTQALYDAGMPISRLEKFLITHSHADHIGGLEEIQLFGRYVTNNKPTMIVTEEYQSILWEQSLRGGSELSESTPLEFEDLWNVIRPRPVPGMPRETREVDIGPINLKMPRTMHYPDDAVSWDESQWSCGVIVDNSVFYTSDTRFDEELLTSFDALFHFDIIFHDCQLFTGGVHASIDELATLPAGLKSRIILMHYGDNWRDFDARAREAGFHSWAKQGHSYRFEALAAAAGGS